MTEERALSIKNSFAGGEWQSAFANGFGSVYQRFADILGLDIRAERKNILLVCPSATRATCILLVDLASNP